MSLRIVHVVRQYTPSIGGLEAVVARLADEQRRRLGHEVRVVTLDRLFGSNGARLPAHEVVDGIEVTRLAWRGSTRYPLCPQVLAHLGTADLVHVHAIDFFFDWLSATRLFHRKPLVASTHGGFFHTRYASTLKRLWFQTITRISALGYRRLIATSENDGAVFERIARGRVTVVENGAELERFHDAAAPVPVPTLIYFGRWSINKGLASLIDLFAALHALNDTWRLIIAGRPSDLDVAELEALIAAKAVIGAVELHASPSDLELRALMGRAMYFACLSRHEGFGIAAIEAMSAGLVPLLSDIPPFRKIVDESGEGLVLRSGESAKHNAERIAQMHASGQAFASRHRRIDFTRRYDWARTADRYDAVYREVLPTMLGQPRSAPS